MAGEVCSSRRSVVDILGNTYSWQHAVIFSAFVSTNSPSDSRISWCAGEVSYYVPGKALSIFVGFLNRDCTKDSSVIYLLKCQRLFFFVFVFSFYGAGGSNFVKFACTHHKTNLSSFHLNLAAEERCCVAHPSPLPDQNKKAIGSRSEGPTAVRCSSSALFLKCCWRRSWRSRLHAKLLILTY